MLGVLVNPVDVQNEGMERVFNLLEDAGVTDICITPKLAIIASRGEGIRFPPLHIDGHQRVLSRPLWGKNTQQLRFVNSFKPDPQAFAGKKYQPLKIDWSLDLDFTLPQRIIETAARREIRTHIITSPFLPPDIDPADKPVRINGTVAVPPQVSNNACINNPYASAYGLAIIIETIKKFPESSSLFMDWVEYGAYDLKDLFTCFCPYCEKQALEWGFDFPKIRHDIQKAWEIAHHLDDQIISNAIHLGNIPFGNQYMIEKYGGIIELLKFKAETVLNFYRKVRKRLDDLGFSHVEISARGWPPPWNLASGMDYSRLTEVCGAATPKLFFFDYSALPRWYGRTLMEWNPSLDEKKAVQMLLACMNLADERGVQLLDQYYIPPPEERHPFTMDNYEQRLEQVLSAVAGKVKVKPFVHAYLPPDQWADVVSMVNGLPADGIWVQMYGYLSGEKFEILANNWRKS